ncbi:MAG: DUF4154 domain-containing protein [Candidatus Marinimicrobia bacterium]|nr:DUF4154 domain-containing protein [Candidatus Neomarinimicrobiota bacterium]
MKKTLTTLAILFIATTSIFAQYKPADPSQVTQMLSMACVFEKTIASLSECSIYVYDNADIEKAVSSFKGQKLGNATLKNLTAGNSLPSERPDIILIGNSNNYAEILAYCNENDVLSLTNIPSLVKKGVTLGMGIDDAGAPKLLINPEGVAEQGKNFNPAIMKMAKVFK